MSHVSPKKTQGNGSPKAFIVEVLKKEGNSKGENLSYTWGKVRELDALKLFDLVSTHNFISHELALKLGIHEFERDDFIQANGSFKGQEVSITPLIGTLQLYIQGYVDKEDFYISPLKHKDVILGRPWFDHVSDHMNLKVLFTHRGKDFALTCMDVKPEQFSQIWWRYSAFYACVSPRPELCSNVLLGLSSEGPQRNTNGQN